MFLKYPIALILAKAWINLSNDNFPPLPLIGELSFQSGFGGELIEKSPRYHDKVHFESNLEFTSSVLANLFVHNIHNSFD